MSRRRHTPEQIILGMVPRRGGRGHWGLGFAGGMRLYPLGGHPLGLGYLFASHPFFEDVFVNLRILLSSLPTPEKTGTSKNLSARARRRLGLLV